MANPFVILAVASSFGKAYATYQAGMAQKAYYDSQAAVSRLQYKSKEFYFEDLQNTVINFGERHTFTFFYDASMEGNFTLINEDDFFKP